jgi:hypothetical protein
MFRSLAADALGLSDIGKIIDPKDFDKTDIDEYVFIEDNEKIFVVIKSKTDEYCFTNTAFIHLDGGVPTFVQPGIKLVNDACEQYPWQKLDNI